jgi:hypothetical protein
MGMLDQLFAPQDPNTFQVGSLGYDEDPRFNAPAFDDYSNGVPVRKKPEKAFDQDLKKFQETHPLTPQTAAAAAPPMASGQPLPGMLGPEMGGPYGAVPNGAPAPAPAAPSPQIPLPMPRPDEAPPRAVAAAPETAIPPNAAPTAGQRTPSGSPAEGAIDMIDATPGMLSKVWSGIQNNSNLLMGMGAGMMGAPSWATGMGRGFAGAQAGSAADQKLNMQMGSQQQLYQALVNAGVPRQQAVAATTNPELAKTLMASYIGDRKMELKNIKLPNGTEVSVLHNPWTNEVKDLNGQPYNASAQSGLIDPTLTGEDAEKAAMQADPALYRRAMNLVQGKETWPNGRAMNDPKNKAATDLARQIDPDLTEQTAITRNQYARDIGNTKNGVGFQVKGFHQGIEHMLTLARDMEKYNPSGGLGSTRLAHGMNMLKEEGTHGGDLANQINAGAQTVAGEVGKLFSGSAGGGVHERETTRGRFKSINSGPEQAGSLEATLETMEGGLRSLEQQRDRNMGKGASNPQYQFRNQETDAKIAEIKQIIARLRGETAPAAAAPTSGVAGPKKIQWNVVQ